MFEDIVEKIKKYDHITLARHIGPDHDALGSQYALFEAIKKTFPEKKVYTVGSYSQKFSFYGKTSKEEKKELLIVLDTPNISRIDKADPRDYLEVIKIDHHPFIEDFGGLEYLDTSSSSTSEIVYKFLKFSNFKMNKTIAEGLFLGIVSDTNRFLYALSNHTMYLANELIQNFDLNIEKLYNEVYRRDFKTEQFKAWVTTNLNFEDGFSYLVITDEDLKRSGVDAGTGGNLINDYIFIEEFLVWTIITEDKEQEIFRVSIRSKGPQVNKIAEKFNGGGHKFAAGVRIPLADKESVNRIICELKEAIKEYKEMGHENKEC